MTGPVSEREGSFGLPGRVAKTTDRSVLGTMVDFAHLATYIIPEGNWDTSTSRFWRPSWVRCLVE
jgi:hypothetical protein